MSDILNDEKAMRMLNYKAYLLKSCVQSQTNLYDHLCRVLTKVLDERPENACDIFEDISNNVKREYFLCNSNILRDEYEIHSEFYLAEAEKSLFTSNKETNIEAELEEDSRSPLPNLMDLANYFEQAGTGLAKAEMFRIYLSLKHLVDSYSLASVRFWGKIIGTISNYFVAEVLFVSGEEEEEEEEEEETRLESRIEDRDDEMEVIMDEEDDLPQITYKPPVVIPKEIKTGVNKFTYFVCNQPGGVWIKLPQVTPAQIKVSRKIKKFFTGNPDALVRSSPPFPGNEASYLRAQIARISASTQISPIGFYHYDEEEDEERAAEIRFDFVENPDFEGITLRDLIEPTGANWVHHGQYILPQGRCIWFNSSQRNDELDAEEEEEEEEKMEALEAEPEYGPNPLVPLSEDLEVNQMSPWTIKLSSRLIVQHALVIVKSNLWPGATAFSDGKQVVYSIDFSAVAFIRKFENVYIGYGHKYDAFNHIPVSQPLVQKEYTHGPDVTEASDPTVEEEDALKVVQEEQLDETEELGDLEEDEDEENEES